MASWEIRLTGTPGGNYVGRFIAENLTLDIVNSDEGGFTCELPLSATQTTNSLLGIPRSTPNGFGPKRSDWEIWRGNKLISAGVLTSVNLNKDRDTILLAGSDWIWYLKQRIYPFDPEEYVAGGWDQWPKQWPETNADDPIDTGIIVQALIDSITKDPVTNGTIQGARQIVGKIPTLGQYTKYSILPGDTRTIFDHIQGLSTSHAGFEFDVLPASLEFKVWNPRRDSSYGYPIWQFLVGDPSTLSQTDLEMWGQIIEFDWTNEGPDGTYLIGLATKDHRVGRVWTDPETLVKFSRLDLLYDYGELTNLDSILDRLQDQQDLYPQKKLSLSLLNPEFMPLSFYSGGYPRGLLGMRIRVTHDFVPYHKVDAYFRINSIRWTVDQSTNEQVDLGLEMLYPPDVLD